jgi:hypothetical protein
MQNETIQNEQLLKNEKKKSNVNEFIMPTRESYSMLLSQNYTVKQLKEIANHHKIKLRGTIVKAEILSRIYNYFKLYDNAFTIQKAWRRYLFRQYNKLRGPARYNRALCVNDTDFFTMDELKDISYSQFFSFKDIDNTIYGFDIMSIYNLFDKGYVKATNPYNRNDFPRLVKKNMMKIIWLSHLFKDPLHLNMANSNDDPNNNDIVMLPPILTLETRIINLFHDIDLLGNYTNSSWFLELSQPQLVRFILELNDIWSYRAGLTEELKNNICPNNHRDLFRMLYVVDIRVASVAILREISLNTAERLVNDGVSREYRCLGANYVLCALTMVNSGAAEALPWLYQSVV